MRLLDVKTFEIHEFFDEDGNRPYAILSHVWGPQECTFQQMTMPGVELRTGYKKIKYCCEQAAMDGLQWAWIDTCCIDKTNMVELSEAINSMFKWYRQAAVCYAYLADIETVGQLRTSRWFTRGWTLQELIAPNDVRFHSATWQYLGDKFNLCKQISDITSIQSEVLSTGQFEQVTIAQRMCWAANRKTTRVEDASYCLLGIFDVNMPLLYGEGSKAFIRLQEGIMRASDDQTLFAWNLPIEFEADKDLIQFRPWVASRLSKPILIPNLAGEQACGLLADSPTQFLSQHQLRALPPFPYTPAITISNGVQIELPVVLSGDNKIAILPCTVDGHLDSYLGFTLQKWDERWHARVGQLFLVAAAFLESIKAEILFMKKPITRPSVSLSPLFRLQLHADPGCVKPDLEAMDCLSHVIEHDAYTMEPQDIREGPMGVYVISSKEASKARLLPHIGFAIVIGLSPASLQCPWLVFIPLCRPDHYKDDFQIWDDINSKLSFCCMTKQNLMEMLDTSNNTEASFLARKSVRFDQEWMDGSKHRWKSAPLGGNTYKKSLSISIEFNVAHKNLVEMATFVNVKFNYLWSSV